MTGIWVELSKPLQPLIGAFLISSAKGVDTAVWLATAPELAGVSGEYFFKRKVEKSSRASRDEVLAARLRQVSEVAELAAGLSYAAGKEYPEAARIFTEYWYDHHPDRAAGSDRESRR